MSGIVTVIIAVFLFLFTVAVHEFGHFVVSKYLGVNVFEFSIGMGPVLVQKQLGNTKYSIRAIPLGGYCDMEGNQIEYKELGTDEDGSTIVDVDIKKSTDPNNLAYQPAWLKILVYVAGPFFNFLLALIVMSLVLCIATDYFTFAEALKDSLACIGAYFVLIYQTIASFFTHTSSGAELVGVVGLVNVIAEEAEYGFANLMYFMGTISINLGIMNLLPIPALDGGRIVLTIIRSLSGGKLGDTFEEKANGIGVTILIVLMAVLIIKDFLNIFFKL